MPAAASAWVWLFIRSRSSKRIRPEDAFRSPITLFMSVVLPAPLRPMRPVMLPLGSSSDTPRRICTDWMETFRSSISSTGTSHDIPAHFRIGERGRRRGVGDDPAVVEGEHAPGEAAHHLHVVLDEEHR